MKTLTCKWCWEIYFPENKAKHSKCKRSKFAHQLRVKDSLKYDKTREYLTNIRRENWAKIAGTIKITSDVLGSMDYLDTSNLSARNMSKYERYAWIEMS